MNTALWQIEELVRRHIELHRMNYAISDAAYRVGCVRSQLAGRFPKLHIHARLVPLRGKQPWLVKIRAHPTTGGPQIKMTEDLETFPSDYLIAKLILFS